MTLLPLLPTRGVISGDGTLSAATVGKDEDNFEERTSKRSRSAVESSPNNINLNLSVPSLLNPPIILPNQTDLEIAVTKTTINPSETSSGNQIQPMDGVEMEEINEVTAIEEDLTLNNTVGAVNKVIAKGAGQSQDKP
ncbi:uncharacterized protein LOC113283174 [Papaver somniferum]|uniref:uncharacterized protein LOC113283174 n=1 Tax=Papaver somniferum TaxID=3469 RepID=UPI000E700F45|nr:uncharacterized protein LOC113283174 [Papaver somniferum]